jgi:hypothetical protein
MSSIFILAKQTAQQTRKTNRTANSQNKPHSKLAKQTAQQTRKTNRTANSQNKPHSQEGEN